MPSSLNTLAWVTKLICRLCLTFFLLNFFILADADASSSADSAASKSAISNDISADEGSSVENSLYSGAATQIVPIQCLPGRAGLTPKVELIYNSYKKNGWLGIGWDLDVGHIRRATKFGINYSSNDFEASIDGEIIGLVPAPDWGSKY